jgi:hypothetical protein
MCSVNELLLGTEQMGGTGFTPGAQQQQPGQQQAGGLTMTAEDIATLTSKPEVRSQVHCCCCKQLSAADTPAGQSHNNCTTSFVFEDRNVITV